MITWMQRHRKWLVITIWISTIAFVGAGFVGWGMYDFNLNRTSSVAKVGDEKIGFMEFNRRFAQIFNYYKQLSDGALTEQEAKERGLDGVALQTLIEDKLLLSFAKELGIGAGEDEIISILITDKEFADESGNFDKEIYYKLLAQNEIDAKDYEQMLTDTIILTKLSALFNLPVSENELQMLASNFFMQDNLSIAKVEKDNAPVNFKGEEAERKMIELWQQYKDEFKTQKYYEISEYFLPAKKDAGFDKAALQAFYDKNKQDYKDFNGKILAYDEVENEVINNFALEQQKGDANRAYLALTKKELEFQRDLNITDSDVYYPTELLNTSKAGAVLKPFVFEKGGQNGYMIVRVNSINPARTKTFDEAKNEISPLYALSVQKERLSEKARKALSSFKGKNIGLVSRDSTRNDKIVDEKMMNDGEFSFFLMNVFNANDKAGFVLFDDKAILYSINAQRLPNSQKVQQYKETLTQNVKNIKANELKKELLAQLRKKYAVEIYYEMANATNAVAGVR